MESRLKEKKLTKKKGSLYFRREMMRVKPEIENVGR